MIFKRKNKVEIMTDLKILIENQEIQKVPSTKFLGLHIDHSLTWAEQIENIKLQLSKGLYILNKIKNMVPVNSLKSIYYTLIHSYLNYGCLLWGNTNRKYLKKIETLQKRAVRIISKSSYNAPTSEIFKRLSILNLKNIYILQTAQFMYMICHNPSLLKSVNHFFKANNTFHTYFTRQNKAFHLPIFQYDQSYRSILYEGPKTWLDLSNDIKESTNMKSFSYKLKKILLS